LSKSNKTKKIYLIGAGGHFRSIIDLIHEVNKTDQQVKILGFFDDNKDCFKGYDFKYLGIIENIKSYITEEENYFHISIGSNKLRREISKKYNVKYISLIHPRAIISDFSLIEEGTAIMGGVILNSGVKIGKHCILNTGSIVDHDCIIGSFVHVAPGVTLSGNVKVGQSSWIGTGSQVIQNIEIGSTTLIGAGSTVVKNLGSNILAYGVPCEEVGKWDESI